MPFCLDLSLLEIISLAKNFFLIVPSVIMKSSSKMCLKWAEGIVSSCYPAGKRVRINQSSPPLTIFVRHKITNPEKMRSSYGKLIYLLMVRWTYIVTANQTTGITNPPLPFLSFHLRILSFQMSRTSWDFLV